MDNQISTKKLYYTITEVAVLLKVNPSLLRFWEKEFDILSPKKNKKGTRSYTQKDIETINKIYVLVKEQGFTLDGAKKHLKLKEQPSEVVSIPTEDVIKRLECIKVKLQQLAASI